ncbi:MAG: hypothetical protein FWC64_05130 [Treponema sp.]|nr:hypothetical protein [Treponema sp.]
MKGKKAISFGFIVLLAVMFTLAGCDNGTTTRYVYDMNRLFPNDTYTHATGAGSKNILTGTGLDAARRFLMAHQHYGYIDMGLPAITFMTPARDEVFNPAWRAPFNNRVYRGPFFDPIIRSVNWLTINPNGAINNSLGSYWMIVPPNTPLRETPVPAGQHPMTAGLYIPNNEVQGYQMANVWQLATSMAPGQSVTNFIERRRGTFAIDAALFGHPAGNFTTPGVAAAAGGVTRGWQDRNHLFVEVRLRNYSHRLVTAYQMYRGWLPTTTTGVAVGRWQTVSGWGADAITAEAIAATGVARAQLGPARSLAQFWGEAAGAGTGVGAAHWNLNNQAERDAFIARAEADWARIAPAKAGAIVDMWFDIMQIVNVTQELGFDYEMPSGAVNGLIREPHYGLICRFPADWGAAAVTTVENLVNARQAAVDAGDAVLPPLPTQAQLNAAILAITQRGRVILQNEWESRTAYWTFYLDHNQPWWWGGFPAAFGTPPGVDAVPLHFPGFGSTGIASGLVPVPAPAWYNAGALLTAANLMAAVGWDWNIGPGGFTLSNAWDGIPLRRWGNNIGQPLRTLAGPDGPPVFPAFLNPENWPN